MNSHWRALTNCQQRYWPLAADSTAVTLLCIAQFRVGEVTSPLMYNLPHYEELPEVEITAITMRSDRPIYRNHQACPDTDHQTLPRLCHEAVLFNRLSEIKLTSRTCGSRTWGAALSCILQFNYSIIRAKVL